MTLGMLVAAPGGRARVQYAFTPADVVWLARLLAAASSGPHRGRVRAILWRALARFAFTRRPGLSLAAFIQQLEPSLPRAPWGQLPDGARHLALAAGRGQLTRRRPNAPVQVMPHGGYAPQGGGYGGGYGHGGYGYGGPRPYGWRGEAELMEAAPPGAPAPDPPAQSTPAQPAPTRDARTGQDAGPVQAGPDQTGPAQTGADDVPDDGGAMVPPPVADEPMPPPSSFDTMDGNRLDVNPQWLRSLLRRWRRRHPGWWGGAGRSGYPGAPNWRARYPYARPSYGARQPWRYPGTTGAWGRRPVARAPFGTGGTLVGRLGRLARNARRVGTLRAVGSGRRYPVFGGRVAGRNFRIITRPRGGMRHEIMAVRGSALQQELAG
jgi:hypothetical protein